MRVGVGKVSGVGTRVCLGVRGGSAEESDGAALKRTWPLALAPLPTPPSFASSLTLFLVRDHLLQGQGQGVHPR